MQLTRSISPVYTAPQGTKRSRLGIYELDGSRPVYSPSIQTRYLVIYRSPLAELTAPKTNQVKVGSYTQDQVPQTPATPVSAEALTSLLNMIKQVPDDEANRQHKERLQQKHTNATQLSFAERALLVEQNRFLARINNEAKVRRSTESDVLGTVKVMSYEDLEKAKAERAAKDAAKEAKKAEREAKKAEKEAKKAAKEAEDATAGKSTRGRKRKSPVEVDASEPKAKVVRKSGTLVAEDETAPTPWRAPVARMY